MTRKLDHHWTYREVDGNVADQGASSPDMEVISDGWRLGPSVVAPQPGPSLRRDPIEAVDVLPSSVYSKIWTHLIPVPQRGELPFLPKSVIRVVANGEALQDFYSVTVHPCTNHVHERHYHT